MKKISITSLCLICFAGSSYASSHPDPRDELPGPSRKKHKSLGGEALSVIKTPFAAPPVTVADLTDLMGGLFDYEGQDYTLAGHCFDSLVQFTQGNFTQVDRAGARNLGAMNDHGKFELVCLTPEGFQSPNDPANAAFEYVFFPTLLGRPGPVDGFPVTLERPKMLGESLTEYSEAELEEVTQAYLASQGDVLPLLLDSQAEVDYMNHLQEGSAYIASERDILERKVHLGRLSPEATALDKYNLGIIYYSAEDGRDFHPQARNFLTEALKSRLLPSQAVADAQYSLGIMYYNAEGGDHDYEQARVLFEWALSSNHLSSQYTAYAQYNLGYLYINPLGGEGDFFKARRFLKEALESDLLCPKQEADAKYNLGAMYYRGEGGDHDHPQARNFLTEALNSGLMPPQCIAYAECFLGRIYYEAQGVEANYPLARALLTKARESNYLKPQALASVKAVLKQIERALESGEGSSS